MSGILFQYITDLMPTLEGWCTPEKAMDLASLVIEGRPKVCTELGIFGGRSLLAIAMALRHNGGGMIYGIDPWSKDAALEGEKDPANLKWWAEVDLEDVYSKFVDAVVANELLRECRWLRMPSERAVGAFSDASIDLFHQDSNHSELVSCRDVTQWAPKLRKRATWILDDADWPSQAKAITMIKKAGFKVVVDRKTYLIFKR